MGGITTDFSEGMEGEREAGGKKAKNDRGIEIANSFSHSGHN
jgi:hypothetical protein